MQIKDLIPWLDHDGKAPEPGRDVRRPLAEFQREMNRMFDSFWSGAPALPGGRATPEFGSAFWSGGAMQADVVETDEAVEVTIELPGIEERDVDLTLALGALTIKGEKRIERQEDKKGYHLSERRYGAFQRVIGLPDGVDPDAATASFRQGVLKVTLPKLPEAKSRVRKIDISVD